MSDFITMVVRIETELRRSNSRTEVKNAINDAIREGAQTRFFFNEMKGVTFNTAIGTEYYDDLGLTEVDSFWFTSGGSRRHLTLRSNLEADAESEGTNTPGLPDEFSRQGALLRLYPIPSSVIAMFLEGYGRLTPFPLTADAHTNAWMTHGEFYIRALAKRNFIRDVARDYGEARTLDAIAEDYKDQLLAETSVRFGTGTLKATRF